MDNYLSFDTKIGPRNHYIAKLGAFFICTQRLNNGAVTESTRKVHGTSLGYHCNIALKQNGGQDKYSYFYNIFGSGASRIAYYCLSYTNLLYMIYISDK